MLRPFLSPAAREQGLLARHGFETAAAAAAARRAAGVDCDMAELAAEPPHATKELTPDDDACPDADLT